jgi:CBS domain containing-hemolysin-like protein
MFSRLAAVILFLTIFWYENMAVWTWLEVLSLVGLAVLITAIEWGSSLVVLYNPERWMIYSSSFINLIYQISRPLLSLLFLFTRKLEETQKKLDQVSEEELKSLVDESRKSGLLEEEEQRMIHSVFRLDDTLTREIMLPRIDIQAIDAKVPFSEAIQHFVDSGFSRIPVYRDNVDNILGLLYAKDLLEICSNGTYEGGIADLVREAYFVPESKVINELLTDMQKKRIHQAIVVDEYGGVAGIVTLEDIIEEIFGEIQDEYDEEEGLYFTVGLGEYIFQGKIDIDDLNLILGSSLPTNKADTLGGLVYYHLGHVPNRGEVVEFDDLLIKVEQVDEHRIIKVRVKKLSSTPASEETDKNELD